MTKASIILLLQSTLLFTLFSCSYKKPLDESFKTVESAKNRKVKVLVSKEYPLNFLACRADGTNEKYKSQVDAVINSLRQNNKDVVLYFHGGLSHQKYIVEKLGSWLMKSMFNQDPVRSKVHPIFLSYDVGPVEVLLDNVSPWNFLKKRTKDIKDNVEYTKLIKLFSHILTGEGDGLNKTLDNNKLARVRAANIVLGTSGVTNNKVLDDASLSESERKYLISILDSDFVYKSNRSSDNKEFQVNDTIIKTLSNQLTKLEESGTSNDAAKLTQSSIKTLPSKIRPEVRILRVLARYALSMDHDIFATIQEEFYQHIGLDKLAKLHWNEVKKRSKECFSEDSVGRYLIDQLTILNNERKIKINTLSHSAGSIPTAQLVNYIAKNNKLSLNSIVMLVPAINQLTFNQLIAKNQDAYSNLTVTYLNESNEKDDETIHELAYSSSLLYFVSGLAEVSPALDTMLLLDQHLKPNSKSYSSKFIQKKIDENPIPVWDMLLNSGMKNSVMKYPFDFNASLPANAATHEGTKFPWRTPDLSKFYLKIFGITDADKLEFIRPKEAKP